MPKKTTLNPVTAALGTTFAISLAASPVINAAENPFSITDHQSGYMVAEGNCGDMKTTEGNCGDKKEAEGKCGDKKEVEGNCGDMKKTQEEGKCGEGKCGENK